MKRVCFVLISLFLWSCSGPGLEKELESIKHKFELAEQKLNLAEIDDTGQLAHLVFFKLKPDVETQLLMDEIKKLHAIESIQNLEYGPFENLDDTRAMSEFSIVMELTFDTKADYVQYQNHAIHLALKEKIQVYLAGPPVTFDYIRK